MKKMYVVIKQTVMEGVDMLHVEMMSENLEDCKKYLDDLGCDVELLFDYDMVLCSRYGVSGFPMTFMFNDDDKYYGYIPGYLPLDDMRKCLEEFTGD